MHLFCNLPCIFFNGLYIFLRKVLGWNNASRVTGMNPRQFDMFHNCRHKGMDTIADGISLTLRCMVQKTVDQNRPIRCHANCRLHIANHTFSIIDNFHTTSAKNIGRTYHHRITNLISNCQCIFYRNSHTGFRHRNFQFIHHGTEQIPVLCQINDRRCRSENLHTILFQSAGQIQRCLSAELGNDAYRIFFLIDA